MNKTIYINAHTDYIRARVSFLQDLKERAEKIGFPQVSRVLKMERTYVNKFFDNHPSHDRIMMVADAIEKIEKQMEALK